LVLEPLVSRTWTLRGPEACIGQGTCSLLVLVTWPRLLLDCTRHDPAGPVAVVLSPSFLFVSPRCLFPTTRSDRTVRPVLCTTLEFQGPPIQEVVAHNLLCRSGTSFPPLFFCAFPPLPKLRHLVSRLHRESTQPPPSPIVHTVRYFFRVSTCVVPRRCWLLLASSHR